MGSGARWPGNDGLRQKDAALVFLKVAALSDTEIINISNIARETGVAASTARDHFSILEDTLIGAFLPSFKYRTKRRMVQAPKFYFRDVGIVNHLALRGQIKPGSELFGKAFESWIFHELSVHSSYSELFYSLSYWRTATGHEVDFILGEGQVALEVKGKAKLSQGDFNGLKMLAEERPETEFLGIVCCEPQIRRTKDGFWVLPYQDFIQRLWSGDIISQPTSNFRPT